MKSIVRLLRRPAAIAITCGLLLLIILVLGAQAQGIGGWRLAFTVPRNQTLIAKVNGESVYLDALERSKILRMAFNPGMEEAVAYQQAMQDLVREIVLVQEARRRGLSVSEEEARQIWEQMHELLLAAPEGKEYLDALEDQRKALGLSPAEYEKQLIAVYGRGRLIGKLREALSAQAPTPSPEEVEAYLAQQPPVNVLILIPLEFTDLEYAKKIYRELHSLYLQQTSEDFETTLIGYAQRLKNLGPEAAYHQEFRYNDISELPDYGRAALDQPENTLNLFEREDGTAVIYYILKSYKKDLAEAPQAAYQALSQEKQKSYVAEIEKTLIEQAVVEYFVENLPPAARSIAGTER